MRVAINAPFHVNCQYTQRSICYCVEGTPPELRDPIAAKQYIDNAEILNQFWQRPAEALFNSTDAVDVIVPRLLRRERVQAAAPEPPKDALSLQLEEARKKAIHSAKMAASLAARGGLLYSPPLGVDIKDFMQKLKMHDQTKLEEIVAQIFKNRSAMGIAATKEAAYPHTFVRHGGNGMSGAGGSGGAAAGVPIDGLRLMHQQQLMMTNPERMRFPKEHQRGPRKRGPPKAWRLAPEHNAPSLVGQLIQILVESPREWRPAIVSAVHTANGSATVVFESDAMQVVPMQSLIENEEVAWLKKEQAEEYSNSKTITIQNKKSLPTAALSGGSGGGGGGGGSAGKKRGASEKIVVSAPSSKYQAISPFAPLPSIEVYGAAGVGFQATAAGGGGGANGAMGADGFGSTVFPHTAFPTASALPPPGMTLKKREAIEEEEDKEKIVLERLKGVTKRQRAAAAKKAAAAKLNNPDSLTAAAGAAAGGGGEMGAPDLSRQEQQASISLPPGFIPLDDDNLPTMTSRQNSIQMANSSFGFGAVQQQQQQQYQQQQQRMTLSSGAAAALVMPALFQLGDEIMRGKGLKLTINNITLPATVLKIEPEKQSILLSVLGRTVVLGAPDEGTRFKLAFV